MSQLPSTPTSLAPISPSPLNTSFFIQQQQDGLISPVIKEEISTIFVVGFPEDMQEREFQNMFMFSPGFEAATLKVPNGNKDEEDYLMNGNNGRKQIIGFAKFRTRKEAFDARDVLNGRKVDFEKGNMLKAEMAKKNLHTKRSLLNEQQQQQQQVQQQQQHMSLLQGVNATNTATTTSRLPTPINNNNSNNNNTAYEAFYSVPHTLPNELMSPNESYSDFYSDLMLVGSPSPDSAFISRSQSVDARSMDLFVQPSISSHSTTSNRFPITNHNNRFNLMNTNSLHEGLDYLSKSTPTTDRSSSFQTMNSFLYQQNNINNNNSININNNNKIASNHISPTTSTGLSRVMEEFFHHQPSMSTPPLAASSSNSSPGILSPTTSYRSLGGMLVGSSNPADQNPPCNTLYVGNLPPNTNEEELKNMFCKCPGYKRLSFRNKSNGPMCFVEFEDAIYAAQALQDLHGNPLSNSVKGGIRLSFSKNPLGVRQNNNTQSQAQAYPMLFNNRRESVTTSNFDPQLS